MARLRHYVRVEERATGHQVDIPARQFDPEKHLKVNKPARYPDLIGYGVRQRPPKHRVGEYRQRGTATDTTPTPEAGMTAEKES